MSLFRNTVKTSLLFFAVGIAVALVAPPICVSLGIMGTGTAAALSSGFAPLINGITFGVFGAVSTALSPLFNAVFDKPEPEMRHAMREYGIAGHAQSLAPAPEYMLADEIADKKPTTSFVDMVDASRVNVAERTH